MKDRYQIRLFRKGKIEIFQHVFAHRLSQDIKSIEIKCGSEGSVSVFGRDISECYEIKLLDNPNYEFETEFPKDIEVLIYANCRVRTKQF